MIRVCAVSAALESSITNIVVAVKWEGFISQNSERHNLIRKPVKIMLEKCEIAHDLRKIDEECLKYMVS